MGSVMCNPNFKCQYSKLMMRTNSFVNSHYSSASKKVVMCSRTLKGRWLEVIALFTHLFIFTLYLVEFLILFDLNLANYRYFQAVFVLIQRSCLRIQPLTSLPLSTHQRFMCENSSLTHHHNCGSKLYIPTFY